MTNPRTLTRLAAAGAAATITLAACGGGDESSSSTSRPPGDSSATVEPATGSGADAELSTAIQEIIDASLEPGAIDWHAEPTGVAVGVRAPGRDDILLASGATVGGAEFDPTAPFSAVTLGWAASLEVAIELVADGTLDPDATIDAWLPTSPNADRITVQMLIDGTHGWGGFAASPVDLRVEHIVSDPARRWSLDEVLETYEVIPPASDPGQFDMDARPTGLTALAYIAQEVTGRPYADLVAEHLAVPAGLDGTFLTDGADLPDGFQHGRFDYEGTRDTSGAPVTALATYEPVDWALVSTVPDLLDMIDTWVDGTWRPGGSPVTPSMFPDERADDTTGQIIGLGVPYHGYCPCTSTGDGNEVTSIGRRPYRVGTELHTLHYLEDGVSVVVLFNSDAWADRSQIIAVVDQIHAVVGASL